MGTKRKLPGLESLGISYDVNGYFADTRSLLFKTPLFTLQFGGYDPNNDPNSQYLEVYGTPFYYPTTVGAAAIQVSQVNVGETVSVTDREIKLNVSAQAEGWYEGFSGSVTANFERTYRTSANFYMLTQMGLNEAYRISLPSIYELGSKYLTEQAYSDINNPGLPPSYLVSKYGAFFLHSGIWGGTLNYSQSISTYSVETETAANLTISANYLKFISSTVKTGVQVDNISSTTQSNGIFECKGGNPSKLTQGWEAWSADLTATGTYVLVDFDSYSLLPISVLAQSADRQLAINEYIHSLANQPVPELNCFWRDSATAVSSYTNGSSKTGAQVTLMASGSQNVIVGVAVSATKDKVTRLAFKLLDLWNNTVSWLTSDGRVFNTADYQRMVDVTVAASPATRAVAVTGAGFTVTDGKVSNLVVYYQNLNPADAATKPTFLDPVVHKLYDADSSHAGKATEVGFVPPTGNRAILTGLALHVSSDNFNMMEIWQENLKAYTVAATTAAQQEAKYKG